MLYVYFWSNLTHSLALKLLRFLKILVAKVAAYFILRKEEVPLPPTYSNCKERYFYILLETTLFPHLELKTFDYGVLSNTIQWMLLVSKKNKFVKKTNNFFVSNGDWKKPFASEFRQSREKICLRSHLHHICKGSIVFKEKITRENLQEHLIIWKLNAKENYQKIFQLSTEILADKKHSFLMGLVRSSFV